MKIGALVPARFGSKRLPQKNIKKLKGRPLICWTLDVLLESNIFYDITVSTESREIAEVVRRYYSPKEVNILFRPEELATDDAPLISVCHHYLEHRPDLDWLGLFMPTYPFRSISKLHEIYWAISSFYPWRVISVVSEEVCLMDYYYPVEGGVKRFFMDPALYCRSNLCAYLLWHRMAIDRGPAEGSPLWAKYGLTITEREYRVHINFEEAVDIDTYEDFEIAEKIANGAKITIRRPKISHYNDWTLVTPEEIDVDKLIDVVGRKKFEDYNMPLLVLEEADPPLGFVRIQDGGIRRYFIRPEGLALVNSDELKRTGNSRYINKHFRHVPHYRFIRVKKDNYNQIPAGPDVWGIRFGLNNETIPENRIIFVDFLKKQGLYWNFHKLAN